MSATMTVLLLLLFLPGLHTMGGSCLYTEQGTFPSQLNLSGNAHTDHSEVKFPNLLRNSQANIVDDHTEVCSKIAET